MLTLKMNLFEQNTKNMILTLKTDRIATLQKEIDYLCILYKCIILRHLTNLIAALQNYSFVNLQSSPTRALQHCNNTLEVLQCIAMWGGGAELEALTIFRV